MPDPVPGPVSYAGIYACICACLLIGFGEKSKSGVTLVSEGGVRGEEILLLRERLSCHKRCQLYAMLFHGAASS